MYPLILLFTLANVVASLSLYPHSHYHKHRPHPRDLFDICANIDASVAIPDSFGLGSFFSSLDVCLCISALPLFIETNVVAKTAALLAGRSAVMTELTALINTANDRDECSYPLNSEPICSSDDPCGFTCASGYHPAFGPGPASLGTHYQRPRSCVCPPPFVECNGVCGRFSSCGSNRPKKRSESTLWRDAGEVCGMPGTRTEGRSICGIVGRGRHDWECIDTSTDLESCGGCIVPLFPTQSVGVDCTLIDGVRDVSCQAGSCHVTSCKPGWIVHHGSTCVPLPRTFKLSSSSSVPASLIATSIGLDFSQLEKRTASEIDHDTFVTGIEAESGTNIDAVADVDTVADDKPYTAFAEYSSAIDANADLDIHSKLDTAANVDEADGRFKRDEDARVFTTSDTVTDIDQMVDVAAYDTVVTSLRRRKNDTHSDSGSQRPQ